MSTYGHRSRQFLRPMYGGTPIIPPSPEGDPWCWQDDSDHDWTDDTQACWQENVVAVQGILWETGEMIHWEDGSVIEWETV